MSEKRFPPSARRIAKARSEGRGPSAPLLIRSLTLMTLLFLLPALASWVYRFSLVEWRYGTNVALLVHLRATCRLTLVTTGAALAACALVGVGCTVLQTGAYFGFAPMAQMVRSVGLRAWLSRSLKRGPAALCGLVGFLVVLAGAYTPLSRIFLWCVRSVLQGKGGHRYVVLALGEALLRSLFSRTMFVLLIIGVTSWFWSRWRFLRGLRASIEEVREEYRESEGDPHVRAARRGEHRDMIMSELVQRVRTAKVVVVRRR